MSSEQVRLFILVIGTTLISGIGDSQGFIYAANVWQNGGLVWGELSKSALGFSIGIGTYWLSLKYLKELGVIAPETQAIFWFGITIIGVAFISGKFLRWQIIDQIIAITVLLGIGWLLFRTGG